jgi:hypothetical protein
MRDHLHGGKGKDEFDQETFKRCTEFKMIRDVAEDSKHAELDRSDVIVAGIESLGGEATIISPLGSLQTVPPCTLQIEEPQSREEAGRGIFRALPERAIPH